MSPVGTWAPLAQALELPDASGKVYPACLQVRG